MCLNKYLDTCLIFLTLFLLFTNQSNLILRKTSIVGGFATEMQMEDAALAKRNDIITLRCYCFCYAVRAYVCIKVQLRGKKKYGYEESFQ